MRLKFSSLSLYVIVVTLGKCCLVCCRFQHHFLPHSMVPLSSKICSSAFIDLTGVAGLKCYICQSYDSEPCPEEDLKDCPASQAFDRCVVRMQRSSGESARSIFCRYIRDAESFPVSQGMPPISETLREKGGGEERENILRQIIRLLRLHS